MTADHPYKKYEKLKVWKVLDNAISDLVSNGDLDELTARQYVVGYLVEQLKNADVIAVEKNTNGTLHRSRVRAANLS